MLRADAEAVAGKLQRVSIVIFVVIFRMRVGIGAEQADIVGDQGLTIEFEAILGGIARILGDEDTLDRVEACGLEVLVLTIIDRAGHLEAVVPEATKEASLDIVQRFRVDDIIVRARG